MAAEKRLAQDLARLESKLQDLTPVPARLDTSRTMFRAGQESERARQAPRRLWQLTSISLALLCSVQAVLLVQSGEPRVVYVERPAGKGEAAAEPSSVPPAEEREEEGGVAKPPADTEPRVRKSPRHRPADRPPRSPLQQFAAQGFTDELVWRLSDPLAFEGGAASDQTGGEPALIEPIRYSDWPRLLSDAGVKQTKAAGLWWRIENRRLFDWARLFPRQGS